MKENKDVAVYISPPIDASAPDEYSGTKDQLVPALRQMSNK